MDDVLVALKEILVGPEHIENNFERFTHLFKTYDVFFLERGGFVRALLNLLVECLFHQHFLGLFCLQILNIVVLYLVSKILEILLAVSKFSLNAVYLVPDALLYA